MHIFIAHTYIELQQADKALQVWRDYYYKQVGSKVISDIKIQWGCCRFKSSDPPTAGCWRPWGRAMTRGDCH